MKMTLPMKKNLIGTLVFGSIGICFAYTRLTDSPWDFWNNLVATVIGIAIGVPVGLLVNRTQVRQEEERLEMGRNKEKAKRLTKIVGLLHNELSVGLASLNSIKSSCNVKNWTGHRPIKMELWQAFSDGGEIEWIDDPDLVDMIAAAYYHLAMQNSYQNNLLLVHSTSPSFSDVHQRAIVDIIRLITENIDESIDAVKLAKEKCGQTLD